MGHERVIIINIVFKFSTF